jgi:hypothetical protein
MRNLKNDRFSLSRRLFISSAAAFAVSGDVFAKVKKSPDVAALYEKANGMATDTVMVRRIYIDLAGRLPTAQESQTYVRSKSPDKKECLVETLLNDGCFSDYWSMRFADILRVKSEFPINLWPNAVYVYHRRIYDFVKNDEGWDVFAASLLSAQGSNFRNAESNFYRATADRTPEGLSRIASLTFLGKATDKYANLFKAVKFKKTREWKEEIVYREETPDGKSPDDFIALLSGPLKRKFASAFVKNISYWLLSSTKISDADVDAFIAGGFKLRSIVKRLMLSKPYCAGCVTGGFKVRRLDAEVLDDALCDLTKTKRDFQSIAPEPFTFLPPERKSILIEDGMITSSFLLLFGKPARDSGEITERNNQITAKQRLYLFNSGNIHRRLTSETGGWKKHKKPILSNIIRDLYWRYYSRPPLVSEEKGLLARHAAMKNSRDRWRFPSDIAWCLLNSSEFLYQH